MANLGQGGDLRQVKDEDMHRSGGWECMPAGWYRFMVQESYYKPSSAGDGMVLHIHLRCLDPEFSGEEKRDFLTLEHPNVQTVTIARARLKELAIACHHPDPNRVEDSAQLHQIPMMARLGVEAARDPKYGDRDGNQNRVWEYLSVEAWREKHGGNGMQAAAAPRPPAAASASDDDGSVPF